MRGRWFREMYRGKKGYRFSMNIMFVSLGCDKNLADTEMMMGLLDLALCIYRKRTTFGDIQVEPYERYCER